MRYAIIESGIVVNIIESGADFAKQIGAIPAEAGGTHAAIGGTWDGTAFGPTVPSPAPEAEAPSVPESVTRAQGKAALIQEGLWPSVLEYISSIEDPTARALADVALNDTKDWMRTSPFLAAAAAHIGLSDAQLDNLFRTASAIQL